MRIGNFLPATEVEGPGLRAAVWLQGCSIRCRDCCNPEFLPPTGGVETDPRCLAGEIASLAVEGVTILGGEPLDQADELALLLAELRRESTKGVFLFTGYCWDAVQANPRWRAVAQMADLVKAGPFDRGLTPDPRHWIGSRNQTVHFITERYRALQDRWESARQEIEIHWRGDEIVVNGTPLGRDLFSGSVGEACVGEQE